MPCEGGEGPDHTGFVDSAPFDAFGVRRDVPIEATREEGGGDEVVVEATWLAGAKIGPGLAVNAPFDAFDVSRDAPIEATCE